MQKKLFDFTRWLFYSHLVIVNLNLNRNRYLKFLSGKMSVQKILLRYCTGSLYIMSMFNAVMTIPLCTKWKRNYQISSIHSACQDAKLPTQSRLETVVWNTCSYSCCGCGASVCSCNSTCSLFALVLAVVPGWNLSFAFALPVVNWCWMPLQPKLQLCGEIISQL